MVEEYRLEVEDRPSEADVQAVIEGLNAFNRSKVEADGYRRVAVFVRDPENKIVGGLIGDTYRDWLYVAILWVDEGLRGQDYGTRLMRAAEEEARRRGCHHAHVDTMSFQALPFYLKLGYAVWGELDDMPKGYKRYFLRREL